MLEFCDDSSSAPVYRPSIASFRRDSWRVGVLDPPGSTVEQTRIDRRFGRLVRQGAGDQVDSIAIPSFARKHRARPFTNSFASRNSMYGRQVISSRRPTGISSNGMSSSIQKVRISFALIRCAAYSRLSIDERSIIADLPPRSREVP